MPCRDPAVFVTSLELTRLARGAAGPQWIGKAVKGHRRNGHVRAASKTVLERLQRRIASGEAETVPVSVNDDINEIRVLVRRGGPSMPVRFVARIMSVQPPLSSKSVRSFGPCQALAGRGHGYVLAGCRPRVR